MQPHRLVRLRFLRSRCRVRGVDVSDPIPADAVFRRAAGEFDAVIACYHDQGLVPIKLMAFGRAVNVTLGLPIVRTAVDHGTAFDIAGDPSAMIAGRTATARSRPARCSCTTCTSAPTAT